MITRADFDLFLDDLGADLLVRASEFEELMEELRGKGEVIAAAEARGAANVLRAVANRMREEPNR